MHKQDLRVTKTIRQIDHSLISCLQKSSFDRITVDMLCKEALINRSTFYRYYEDKYDLLNNYMNRLFTEFRSFVKVDFVLASAVNVDDQVYQSNFTDLLDHLHSRKDTYLTLARGFIGHDVWNEMSEIIQENIFRKLQASEHVSEKNEKYIRLYSRLFSTDLMSIVLWWFEHDDEVSAEDVKHLMTSNIRDGSFRAFKEYL